MALVSNSLIEDKNQPRKSHILIQVFDNKNSKICEEDGGNLFAYKFDSLLTNLREVHALK